jgi:hypothetical protein
MGEIHRVHVTKRAAVVVAVITMLALAGCAQSTTPKHKSHHSASPSASGKSTSTPSATPTASHTPKAPASPVGLTCAQLLSNDQIYAFNPNFVTEKYSPKAGTLGATMASDSGIACGWVNETSGEVIEIAAERPAASSLSSAKSAAAVGTVAPSSGADAAYFALSSGVGTTQLFVGGYWAEVSSAIFESAADAQPVYSVVSGNLKAAAR